MAVSFVFFACQKEYYKYSNLKNSQLKNITTIKLHRIFHELFISTRKYGNPYRGYN